MARGAGLELKDVEKWSVRLAGRKPGGVYLLGLFPVPRTVKMGLHHFSDVGVVEPPPFGPMRYHNRIACCDAFAILECGRIHFPTCIAYPTNTAGDCDIVRESTSIQIG